MKILSAKHYPDIPRMVIRVVENPDDPQWVHKGKEGYTPSPIGHTGNTNEPGKVCEECHFNWRVHEFIWTRDELYVTTVVNNEKVIRPKTEEELRSELSAYLKDLELSAPADATGLVGLEV